MFLCPRPTIIPTILRKMLEYRGEETHLRLVQLLESSDIRLLNSLQWISYISFWLLDHHLIQLESLYQVRVFLDRGFEHLGSRVGIFPFRSLPALMKIAFLGTNKVMCTSTIEQGKIKSRKKQNRK